MKKIYKVNIHFIFLDIYSHIVNTSLSGSTLDIDEIKNLVDYADYLDSTNQSSLEFTNTLYNITRKL